jgi:hypothetical protein
MSTRLHVRRLVLTQDRWQDSLATNGATFATGAQSPMAMVDMFAKMLT